MTPRRFEEIVARYPTLNLAIVGDFCLDRYLEIEPARAEVSIETGLEVHNVVNVRSQPGAAGTILNNLIALGIGRITPIGFCGDDGEGYELLRCLRSLPGLEMEHFLQTNERRTFTYCKPLVLEPGKVPRELNRLDSKNWSPTPEAVQRRLNASVRAVAEACDAIILMDQVDTPQTGVVTDSLLHEVASTVAKRAELLVLGDSRRSLKGWPRVCLKMNLAEFSVLTSTPVGGSINEIKSEVRKLAATHGRPVFVTLAERGIVAADPNGAVEHCPTFPVRGEIDIVGAGDAVTANLTAALSAGATLSEALMLAMAAASIVIHQLGTTGTASVADLRRLLLS